MTVNEVLLYSASALCVATAFVHSYFGEKRLIGPIIHAQQGVVAHSLAQQVLRFAWHWTSALWILIALYLTLTAQGLAYSRALLLGIGAVHLIAGLVDGICTRGQHIGWSPITVIGVLVLVASL